ncbi:hypothetical protein BWI17_03830 [Betaproteobacteria bacterium GR16-43]|nr:hypothetical protein BWI17_03830 [Betaproteobacteria bacterium GR16-43]
MQAGETYFSLMYADEKLTLPHIETLIYLGETEMDEPDRVRVHLFQYAESFHIDGNWKQMSEETRATYEEVPLVFFELDNVEPICDGDGLIQQLQSWRERSR